MLVGRSLVSAITQTPASGPFELRTTPPRSVSPMLTAGVCCAKTGPGEANAAARAIAATPEYKAALFLISLSSNDFHQVSWLPQAPLGVRPARGMSRRRIVTQYHRAGKPHLLLVERGRRFSATGRA